MGSESPPSGDRKLPSSTTASNCPFAPPFAVARATGSLRHKTAAASHRQAAEIGGPATLGTGDESVNAGGSALLQFPLHASSPTVSLDHF